MASKKEEVLLQKLQAAEARVKELRAQQAAIAARNRAAAQKKQRMEDTRRKILIGAYVLSKESEESILQMMDEYLTEDRDRALFGLPPLPADQQ